ncbi:hypothetical protein [Dactylosporangium sucinum]|uniref:Uncharacterized protein n=1 Tax=Dactylosporangium sucinum TaxID=1424081 RepID=A0A917TYF9_9ACTN|nr:hypothetical protein [Dactylosporangium sucinum]GGM43812.1 hypothetical protein GCM10007977_051740 [Dactylosporangium sucinum]
MRTLTDDELGDVTAEGERLLAFLHPKAARTVRIVAGGWPALLAATA